MHRRTLLLATSAVALTAALGVDRLGQQKQHAAETAYPPIGTIINVNGVDVHYTRQGAGPMIVLLHGAGGNLRDFTGGLAADMAKTNEVIAFDRPGHGYTDPDNKFGASPMSQAILMQAAADQIGVKQAVVLGYSLGGAVALAWGLQEPGFVKSLLLVASVSNPWPRELRLLYRAAANPLTGAIVTPMVAALAPSGFMDATLTAVFDPQQTPEGYADLLGADLSLRASAIRANTRQIIGLRPFIVAMSKHYTDLTMPVALIHGDADTVVPVEIHSDVLAKTLPQADYTRIKGLGHGLLHYAKPQILTALHKLNTLHR